MRLLLCKLFRTLLMLDWVIERTPNSSGGLALALEYSSERRNGDWNEHRELESGTVPSWRRASQGAGRRQAAMGHALVRLSIPVCDCANLNVSNTGHDAEGMEALNGWPGKSLQLCPPPQWRRRRGSFAAAIARSAPFTCIASL